MKLSFFSSIYQSQNSFQKKCQTDLRGFVIAILFEAAIHLLGARVEPVEDPAVFEASPLRRTVAFPESTAPRRTAPYS